MDFTREPVIQTVITPREGCKLVVRSSKGLSQEEYFVDSVEVATIGSALFFRSLEKPKCFLLPATDYEVIEVREARLVLKHVGLDRSIKISGGREAPIRSAREQSLEKVIMPPEAQEEATPEKSEEEANEAPGELVSDKRRERRRHYRRRRGKEEGEDLEKEEKLPTEAKIEVAVQEETKTPPQPKRKSKEVPPSIDLPGAVTPRPVLPPPSTLISETIARYREDSLFKGAFYSKEESDALKASEENQEQIFKGEQESPVNESVVTLVETASEDSSLIDTKPIEEEEDLWNFTDELTRTDQENKE